MSMTASPPSAEQRFLAVLCIRNEGAFLIDWLAHHRTAGFTDVLVFSNDCQDGSDAMLDRLQEMGELTHVRNDGLHEGKGIQFTALNAASRHPLMREADWVMSIDIDEYLNIHVGDGTLPELVDALPDATAVALGWRLFGNGGVVSYEDRPVPEIFTHAAPERLMWPWRAAMFKTLMRNDGSYRKIGVHRPRNPDPARLDGIRWYDGHGRALPGSYRKKGLFLPYGQPNWGLAQVNHYALGAMESFILKADRGRANRDAASFGMDYWVERNFSTEEDRSILRHAPRVTAERTRLMTDPRLSALHESAVAWRSARFDALMMSDEMRSLFGRLLVTPPSRPMPPAQAVRLQHFGIRALATAQDAAEDGESRKKSM